MGLQGMLYTNGTTPLDAATLTVLALTQSCLVSGGIPSTSASLTISQPATQVRVNTGTAVVSYGLSAQSLVVGASQDTYIDVSINGGYVLTGVANGSAAPAVNAQNVRLYKAVSGSASVTSIVPLVPNSGTARSGPTPVNPLAISAPDETPANYTAYGTTVPAPTDTLQQTVWRLWYKLVNAVTVLTQTAVLYDSTQGASATGSASLEDNLTHCRQALASLAGMAFAQILTAGQALELANGTNGASTIAFPGALVPASLTIAGSTAIQALAVTNLAPLWTNGVLTNAPFTSFSAVTAMSVVSGGIVPFPASTSVLTGVVANAYVTSAGHVQVQLDATSADNRGSYPAHPAVIATLA